MDRLRPAAHAEATGGSESCVNDPYGRTRMIVCPLIRSVELKAATASSRVATVPMFVRSRPSRTGKEPGPSTWAALAEQVAAREGDLGQGLGADGLAVHAHLVR